MWIILGTLLLYINSALALSPGEKVSNIQILRILPDNIIQLNRGFADGLTHRSHIILKHASEGFVSRALCLKSSANTSYWRVYRVPNTDALSSDVTYTAIGADYLERPIEEESRKIPKITEEERKVPQKVRYDLTEKLTKKDLLAATNANRNKLFFDKNFKKDVFKKDLNNYKMSFYASPFAKQSINESESIRAGFRGENNSEKYQLITSYDHQASKVKDPLTKDSVSTKATNAQVQFVIKDLTKTMSSLSFAQYNSMFFTELGTPDSHWLISPIGFTWKIVNTDKRSFNFGYSPIIDTRTTDTITFSGVKDQKKTTGLRHGFKFDFKAKINSHVQIENILWVRPYHDLTSWELGIDDLLLNNDLRISFSITEKLFFDYNLIFMKDKMWNEISGLKDTNIVNALNLRYDLEI